MIADYLLLEGAAEAFRESMAAATPRSVLLPSAIDDATAAELRARVDAAGWTPYALADRGRFHYCDTLRVDPLWDELAAVAANLASARVALVRSRWMRFRRGDTARRLPGVVALRAARYEEPTSHKQETDRAQQHGVTTEKQDRSSRPILTRDGDPWRGDAIRQRAIPKRPH